MENNTQNAEQLPSWVPSAEAPAGPEQHLPNPGQPVEGQYVAAPNVPGPGFGVPQHGPGQHAPMAPVGAQGHPGQIGGGAQPFGAPAFDAPGPQAPTIDDVAFLKRARRAPTKGWRRAVYKATGGSVNPGESAEGLRYESLVHAVNQPIRGDYRIAVVSLKGGVGKTTTTVALGSTLASLRGDRVIAVDANPDLGTLAQRVPQQTSSTVRDLLADIDVTRYSDVRAHTSQAPSRLEVLASERDPATAETFNEEEYRGVISVLQRFYNIIITDCGTGVSHSAMAGVLGLANAIILVSSPAIDGARSAAATLDWLETHGYGHLAQRAVVVLSSSRPGSSSIDTEQLGQHFQSRTRAVHSIPFDDHLAEGAEVDLDLVGKKAKMAFVELAATIAEDFGGTLNRSSTGVGRA